MSLIQYVCLTCHSFSLSDMSLIQSVCLTCHSFSLSVWHVTHSVCLTCHSFSLSVWHVTHSVCLSDMSLIQSDCLTVWMMDCLTQTLTDWLTPQTTCPATPALWFNNMSTFLEARPDKLGHCHGCWRSQFLHHQVISNHDIDCKTSRSLSSIQNANKHVMSLWKNSACQIYLTISHLSALQMKQYLT